MNARQRRVFGRAMLRWAEAQRAEYADSPRTICRSVEDVRALFAKVRAEREERL